MSGVAVASDHRSASSRLALAFFAANTPATAASARNRPFFFLLIAYASRVGTPGPPDRSASHTPMGYGRVMRGYTAKKDDVGKRLRRVEGQVRGIARMVEEDAYCIDVLTQVSAATKALEAVALGLLEDHLHHCVAEAIAAGGGEEKITEAAAAVRRLVRS